MRTFDTLEEIDALVGQAVATSDWVTITQEQVNRFAEATGDHQWIHVDVARATAGPFGAPIAHGFLTLSLLPVFFASAMQVRASRMGVPIQVSTMAIASSGCRIVAPNASTFAPLCSREYRARVGVVHIEARTPRILLAAIADPRPAPSMTMPASASPLATALPTRAALSTLWRVIGQRGLTLKKNRSRR